MPSTSAQSLAARLREVLLDGTWIANTNWQDQMAKTDWQDASRAVASLNSVYALGAHVRYYVAGVHAYFQTGTLSIRDAHSFDAPALESAEAWDEFRRGFAQDAQAMVEAVEALSDAQLDVVFADPRYGDCRRNIEGLIEHAYYHLGQVSLIRKLLAETKNA